MFTLEARTLPSVRAMWLAPLAALLLTLLGGSVLFAAFGHAPLQALSVYFLQPLASVYGIGEWLLKATPLALCGLGLALGFRAKVWNIGADGQFTLGAICAGGLAIACDGFIDAESLWIAPAMALAGIAGGMMWAALPAWLRTRYGSSEILSSLMLAYVAPLLLGWLVNGPWRDPAGFNFPQSIQFADAALLAPLHEGARVTLAFPVALILAGLLCFVQRYTYAGFRLQVSGEAPLAARHAGYSQRAAVWIAMLTGGACAGFAGYAEVAGPLGQLQPSVSPGYGFTAIIVAFVGRLDPRGVVLAALLLSLLALGGEAAQMTLDLPAAISGVFQGGLLCALLACDTFVHYRLRRVYRKPAARTS
ncbi:ABC transporter permease [Plasticicumulans sp.]|uniref:ABC transporter permease n=1 Tax=Plasticicumulans sp. TaxID=2307179 RepID=UPI002B8FF30F|nr:ABC transporter permease [Plasticicumulans sp.]HND96918.1 ABC transporter permease [Plasticicumulans sp.]HNM42944.1 ABC transporter permease [Plasticicumulans sp.]